MMNNPEKFIQEVKSFDANNIDEKYLERMKPLLATPDFNIDTMMGKSRPAGFLTAWIINVVKYNSIYKRVKPLMDQAEAAQAIADEKSKELAIVQEKVKVIVDKVNALKLKLDEAEIAKKAVEDEAQALVDMLNLANRLVNGLADENKRWGENV
jgi:dynein heavy chain